MQLGLLGLVHKHTSKLHMLEDNERILITKRYLNFQQRLFPITKQMRFQSNLDLVKILEVIILNMKQYLQEIKRGIQGIHSSINIFQQSYYKVISNNFSSFKRYQFSSKVFKIRKAQEYFKSFTFSNGVWFENYSKKPTLLQNPILKLLSCTETAKAKKLKLCHFSEQLLQHICVKAPFPRSFGNQVTRC